MVYNYFMAIKTFTSYPEALFSLKSALGRREFDPEEYYIVLTPDRYTQSVESALFSGGGALDLEALTLSRLARRINQSGKGLSREGGVMLMARALSEVKSELTYYKRAAVFPEFAREAYDTMQQLCASEAEASKLVSTSAVTKSKIADLALIRSAYLKLKGDGEDATDRMTALIKAVPNSELIKRSHVYAIGFALGYRPTELNCSALSAIANTAKSFEYYDVIPNDAKRERIEAFAAPDRISQYKEIAVRIRDYVDCKKGSYGDVYIVCPEPRALSRILEEYNIKFYHDKTTTLDVTPPLVAINNIYKISSALKADRAVERDAVTALCKNPFSGVDEQAAQYLCDALSLRGKYVDLKSEFKDENAERGAARIRKLCELFDGDFASAVINVVERGSFGEIHKRVYGEDTDTVTPIIELAGLLELYGSSDFDGNAAAFFSAAHAVAIKSLPRVKDCVTVTVPRALRMTKCKMLFVVDFNEGVLPAAMLDTGLLCDDEINSLNALSAPVKIDPTVREQNRRERIELKAVVDSADEVVFSYVTAGRMKKAAFMTELAEHIDETTYAEHAVYLKNTNDPRYITKYACTPAAARELAALHGTKYSSSLKKVAGNCERRAAACEKNTQSAAATRISVSELSDWFACPYKRFLRDVVGVNERKTTALGAPDFGIVVHDFMERFIKNPPYDCSRANVERLIDNILTDKEIEADEVSRERLIGDAQEFASVNVKILEAGEYAPVEFEYRFKGVLGDKTKAEFVGFIDRIDECGNRKRILDYKTGSREFNIKDCLMGIDMQLPLYAYAVGADKVTGFFYVKLPPRYEAKSFKPLHGRLIKDVDVAFEYDRSLKDLTASEILSLRLTADKKTGELSFHGNYTGNVMERDDFSALIDICAKTASLAVDEMSDGYIERTPLIGECDRCAYRGICGDNVISRDKE